MTTLLIADLIGSKVVEADGTRIGSVVDVVVSQDTDLRVLELVIGRRGWIQRLNMANMVRSFDSSHNPDRIPWDRVDRFEIGRITLAPENARTGAGIPHAKDIPKSAAVDGAEEV